jgi:dTDP-glucose 4,6-dehydratase
VLEATGSTSGIAFQPLPVDDPKVRQPDIAKARRLLGWEPRVTLEEGLERTLAYFRPRVGRGRPPAPNPAPDPASNRAPGKA